MELNKIYKISFKEYDSIQDIICAPDKSKSADPLLENTKSHPINQINKINYLDSFLYCFFTRFNKDIPKKIYHLEQFEFKKVFLDELRNGIFKYWKFSSNKKDKAIILQNITKEKLDKHTIQWIADFHNIVIIIDNYEYIPRKNKNKVEFKLSIKNDGYHLTTDNIN